MSRLHARRKSAVSARASTRSTAILRGTHNADALAAGRELVEIAAKRPSLGVWQVLSGKGGSGKTEMLVHLACAAHQRGEMNVAVIDFGTSRTVVAPQQAPFSSIAEADLVLIDNAHCAPAATGKNSWWEDIEQQLRKSACVLVAVTPGPHAAAHDPWRRQPTAWRETEIGSFDCGFRRSLIGELDRRQQAERGGIRMTDGTMGRLAEELWGNGWQLADGVDACRSYANVMERQPRSKEIDEIAANVAGPKRREGPSLGAIEVAVTRACDQELQSAPSNREAGLEETTRDLHLYLTKAITGQPLEAVGRQFALGRRAAMQASRSIERKLHNHPAMRRSVEAKLAEFRTEQLAR
ncbi:MAG: hypothetical protein EKK41_27085 [Hyphomicrobiales bacterium]|nr:MAG: hypothetical protein EKK41_27085 [Hyphomicrobiales bacterium]